MSTKIVHNPMSVDQSNSDGPADKFLSSYISSIAALPSTVNRTFNLIKEIDIKAKNKLTSFKSESTAYINTIKSYIEKSNNANNNDPNLSNILANIQNITLPLNNQNNSTNTNNKDNNNISSNNSNDSSTSSTNHNNTVGTSITTAHSTNNDLTTNTQGNNDNNNVLHPQVQVQGQSVVPSEISNGFSSLNSISTSLLSLCNTKISHASELSEHIANHIARLDNVLKKYETKLRRTALSEVSMGPCDRRKKVGENKVADEDSKELNAILYEQFVHDIFTHNQSLNNRNNEKESESNDPKNNPSTGGDSKQTRTANNSNTNNNDFNNEPADENEPVYCVCRKVSFGNMVACDNKSCPFEWFHFECVGLETKPRGKWFCPKCKSKSQKHNLPFTEEKDKNMKKSKPNPLLTSSSASNLNLLETLNTNVLNNNNMNNNNNNSNNNNVPNLTSFNNLGIGASSLSLLSAKTQSTPILTFTTSAAGNNNNSNSMNSMNSNIPQSDLTVINLTKNDNLTAALMNNSHNNNLPSPLTMMSPPTQITVSDPNPNQLLFNINQNLSNNTINFLNANSST